MESAYMLFATAKRDEAAKECAGVTGMRGMATAMTKCLSAKWTDLTAEDKAVR